MSFPLGSVSSGTMRPEDLIPVFADVLRDLDKSGEYKVLLAEADAIEDYDDVDNVMSDLFDALDTFAPDYCYFGAHPGDGADYGFWLHEDAEQAMADDDVLMVDDTSAVTKDYSGLVCHVNDHGNMTLYRAESGELSEIWSVV